MVTLGTKENIKTAILPYIAQTCISPVIDDLLWRKWGFRKECNTCYFNQHAPCGKGIISSIQCVQPSLSVFPPVRHLCCSKHSSHFSMLTYLFGLLKESRPHKTGFFRSLGCCTCGVAFDTPVGKSPLIWHMEKWFSASLVISFAWEHFQNATTVTRIPCNTGQCYSEKNIRAAL